MRLAKQMPCHESQSSTLEHRSVLTATPLPESNQNMVLPAPYQHPLIAERPYLLSTRLKNRPGEYPRFSPLPLLDQSGSDTSCRLAIVAKAARMAGRWSSGIVSV